MPCTILIADDEAAITEIVAALLDEEGYRVRRAFNGREALDLIAADPPDLVISDVMMPKVDGVELTRQLRAQGDDTPILLMSAVYASVDLPGVQFMPKPFDLDFLIGVVQQTLEHHLY